MNKNVYRRKYSTALIASIAIAASAPNSLSDELYIDPSTAIQGTAILKSSGGCPLKITFKNAVMGQIYKVGGNSFYTTGIISQTGELLFDLSENETVGYSYKGNNVKGSATKTLKFNNKEVIESALKLHSDCRINLFDSTPTGISKSTFKDAWSPKAGKSSVIINAAFTGESTPNEYNSALKKKSGQFKGSFSFKGRAKFSGLIRDQDEDGHPDLYDAFPLDPTESTDTDRDRLGNNTDLDDDNDGVADTSDAFPLDPTEWLDADGDGVGDNNDVFPFDNTESEDTDQDGIGNKSDLDDDNDGELDNSDQFPLDPTEWMDTDGDGIGDNGDAFPFDSTDSLDTDLDGIGNRKDTDDDADGVNDVIDAFPTDANETVDTDGDGIGNNADPDDDNDGIPDYLDTSPLGEEFLPYVKTGPVHRLFNQPSYRGIFDVSFLHSSNCEKASCKKLETIGNVIFHYDAKTGLRETTGVSCIVRVNEDNSISLLDSKENLINHYEWEKTPYNKKSPFLYASVNGAPDPSNYALAVNVIDSINIPSVQFISPKGISICGKPYHENLFQFFVGPALKNWSKFHDTYKDQPVTVEEFKDGQLIPQQLPYKNTDFDSGIIHTTINESTKCSIEVDLYGHVSAYLHDDEYDSAINKQRLGRFGKSDTFIYRPPAEAAGFVDKPFIANKDNYRLLSSTLDDLHPSFNISNKWQALVLELDNIYSGKPTVSIYFGVHDYGRKPGYYAYSGRITCGYKPPQIISVSPLEAPKGTQTEFTVSGINLHDNLNFTIKNCNNVKELPGGTSSQRTFTCTPDSAGKKSGAIKESNNGKKLFEFSVSIKNIEDLGSSAPIACGPEKILQVNGSCTPKPCSTLYDGELSPDSKGFITEFWKCSTSDTDGHILHVSETKTKEASGVEFRSIYRSKAPTDTENVTEIDCNDCIQIYNMHGDSNQNNPLIVRGVSYEEASTTDELKKIVRYYNFYNDQVTDPNLQPVGTKNEGKNIANREIIYEKGNIVKETRWCDFTAGLVPSKQRGKIGSIRVWDVSGNLIKEDYYPEGSIGFDGVSSGCMGF